MHTFHNNSQNNSKIIKLFKVLKINKTKTILLRTVLTIHLTYTILIYIKIKTFAYQIGYMRLDYNN